MLSYLGNPPPDKGTDCIVVLIYVIYRTERGGKWTIYWLGRRIVAFFMKDRKSLIVM